MALEGMGKLEVRMRVCMEGGTLACMVGGMMADIWVLAHMALGMDCKLEGMGCIVPVGKQVRMPEGKLVRKVCIQAYKAVRKHLCCSIGPSIQPRAMPSHIKKSTRLIPLVVFSL